jgi:hypothetical protein
MPNLAQLRANVKARTSTSAESTYDTAINLWLNDAQRDILNRFLWDFARSYSDIGTVAATDTITMPFPGIAYNARNVTSSIPLKFINDLDFDRLFAAQTASGSPRFFRMSGQAVVSGTTCPQIQLYPIPDGAYTIRVRYFSRYADLVNDTDISAIPETYHELMVNYASNVLFSSLNDPRATEQYAKYENGLLSMVEQQAANPASHLNVLRSTDDSSDGQTVRFPASYGNIDF